MSPDLKKTAARTPPRLGSGRNMGNRLVQIVTIGAFLAVCALFASMSPIFLMPANLMNIIRQIAVLAILSFGMTMVIVVTSGASDMSVGGVAGCSAGVTVVLLTAGVPTYLAILCGVGAGVALGLLNGLLVTRLGLLPFLATLATMNIGMGIEQVLTKGTYVPYFDKFINFVANENVLGIPTSAFLLAAVFGFFHLFMGHTATGRRIYAIGGNQHAARSSGINTHRFTLLAFTLSGLTSGLAGVLMVGRLSGLTPLAASPMLIDALLAGYISSTLSPVGAPNIGGSLFGAILVGVLVNGLAVTRVPTFYVNLVKGLLIIVVVTVNALQRRRRTTS